MIELQDSKRNVAICMGPYKKLRRAPRKPKLPVTVLMSTGHPFEVWLSFAIKSKFEFVSIDLFIWLFQKNAEELLDEGSIAYFQEDEEAILWSRTNVE